MITSRQDYTQRLIDEVDQYLARVAFKRRKGGMDNDALETVVFGLQRLFDLKADQIFRLTPEQHFDLLAGGDTPEFGREKVLLYAALSAEAGQIYARQGKPAMARATFTTALRFTLKARKKFSTEGMPRYAPDVGELLAALAGEPLDEGTAKLVGEQMGSPS